MQKVWTNCDMSKYCIWGGPPHDSAIIFWHIAVCSHFLHTFCLLLNLFWTFPLKSIGFLGFSWFSIDCSMISLAFLLIFWALCLRYPSFLFTIALVIKRKKLFPEARTQTRASESLEITSKKIILRFPPFVFTTALVIERKKLSPEARKQTRASESLKMTSKNQLYVSHHFCLL